MIFAKNNGFIDAFIVAYKKEKKNRSAALTSLEERYVFFEKDIKRASKLSLKLEDSIYAYSFDMLGEGARTYQDANKYFENYKNAITVIGETSSQKKHSISIGSTLKIL